MAAPPPHVFSASLCQAQSSSCDRPVRPPKPCLPCLVFCQGCKKNVARFSTSGRWRGDGVLFTFLAKVVDFLRQTQEPPAESEERLPQL